MLGLIFLLLLLLSLFVVYLRLRKYDHTAPVSDVPLEVLEVTVSKNDIPSKDIKMASLAAENMFISLHGLLHESPSLQERISFEMVFSGAEGIKFYVVVPSTIVRFVESQIYAHHPNASISPVSDYTSRLPADDIDYQIANISLSKPQYFPLKPFRDFEADPLSSFTSALSNIRGNEEVWVQFVLRPVPDVWQSEGFDYIKAMREGLPWGKGPGLFEVICKTILSEVWVLIGKIITGLFINREAEAEKSYNKPSTVKLNPAQENEIKSIENKLSKVGYAVNMRVFSYADNAAVLAANLRSFTASLKQYSGVGDNTLSMSISDNDAKLLDTFIKRDFDDKNSMVLSGEELATIYHFPAAHIETPNISWAYSKKSEPPSNLPRKDCVYIGDTVYRNNKVRFGLYNNADRLRHMYVVGKSGVGKSTLFQSMAIQDIQNGAGLCMLDPHGETIDKVLEYIPDDRIKDVIYIDPSDADMPIGLNMLELDEDDPEGKNLMASGLLAAIKHHFDYSWGPRLEYLLNYALLTLVSIKGTTMLSIVRLLTDKNYRNYIVQQTDDVVLKNFWEVEYKEMANNPRFISEAISPIQNKVNRFLASSTMRNLLGQARSTIDIWDIMQNKKILLINLSKGKIGQDNANLLGALLVSRIQFYALQRAKIQEHERTPFYLYVDEFQNFATGSFGEILSESRKYGLGLYLTNQYTAQLDEDILKAVLGNVGTIATFAAGAMDARVIATEFSPFTAEDINTLERFQLYIKLMVDGMSSLPFSAQILLPWVDTEFLPPKADNKEKVLQLSRSTYGTPREYVEAKIEKWMGTTFDKGLAISEHYRKEGNHKKRN